jgi:hypothetical protein
MKKSIFILGTVLFLFSCDKLKDLVNVNFNFSNGTTEFDIPITPAGSYGSLSTKTFYMNLDSLIKANNGESGLEYLKTLTINSIDLTLSNADTSNNFQNLFSCKMKFFTNVKSDTLTIGSLTSNPDTYKSTLNVPVATSIDVKDYAKTATRFGYILQADVRRPTTKILNCKVKVNYQVTCGL